MSGMLAAFFLSWRWGFRSTSFSLPLTGLVLARPGGVAAISFGFIPIPSQMKTRYTAWFRLCVYLPADLGRVRAASLPLGPRGTRQARVRAQARADGYNSIHADALDGTQCGGYGAAILALKSLQWSPLPVAHLAGAGIRAPARPGDSPPAARGTAEPGDGTASSPCSGTRKSARARYVRVGGSG